MAHAPPGVPPAYIVPPLAPDYVPDLDAMPLGEVQCLVRPHPDGSGSEILVGFDRRVYSFVRHLRDALLGSVHLAVGCQAGEGGTFVPDPGAKFCIKKANKRCVAERVTLDGQPCREDFLKEMRVLRYLSDPGHPNIVRYLGMYHDDENYYAVMEFIEGVELFDVVADALSPEGEPVGLGVDRTRRYAQQLYSGLRYMREKHIAHLDASCENAMLERDTDTVKFIDFGCATATDGHGAPARAGAIGKLQYMAPEVFAGQAFNPFLADMWSVGVMVFIMSCGVPAWDTPSMDQPAYSVAARGDMAALLTHWGFEPRMGPVCADLVVRSLKHEPPERLSFLLTLAHAFIGLLPPVA